jgi:hypothetical protein
VLIYQTEDGMVEIRLEQDTVWLRQEQMGQLFGRERSVITKHLRNVFAEGDLDEKSNVQILHIAGSDKPVRFYNLDVIISVGYRVKSKQGTRFRQWATRILREYLTQGYTLSERRLREKGLTEMEQAVQLLARTLQNQALVNDTGKDVLNGIFNYAKSWRLLLQYDESYLHFSRRVREGHFYFSRHSRVGGNPGP